MGPPAMTPLMIWSTHDNATIPITFYLHSSMHKTHRHGNDDFPLMVVCASGATNEQGCALVRYHENRMDGVEGLLKGLHFQTCNKRQSCCTWWGNMWLSCSTWWGNMWLSCSTLGSLIMHGNCNNMFWLTTDKDCSPSFCLATVHTSLSPPQTRCRPLSL
jgi:hypothetical protein